MTSEVFYRKWRPQKLGDVVGQEPVTRTLQNALITQRLSHAYLFFGPRGTGKTSSGRILAKAVNCLQHQSGEPCNKCAMCLAFNEGRAIDLIEIDAASNTGVDDIRNLKEKINFAPNIAKYKVYIIDEVHMLSNSAFNALLKTLEEPPGHVIFILATTEVHKVPPTITSRCQRFDFRRIPQEAMIERLQYICREEGITADPQTLALISRSATGSLRDAQNLLEQMLVYHGLNIELAHVREELGLTGDARIRQLASAILARDVSAGLEIINTVANDGLDLKHFNRELVDYLRQILLFKAGAGESIGLTPEEIEHIQTISAYASLPDIAEAIKPFAQADFRFSSQSTLPLELALVDYALAGSETKSAETKSTAKAPSAQPPAKPKTASIQNLPEESVEADNAPEAVNAIPVENHPPEEKRETPAPATDTTLTLETGDIHIEYIKNHWNDFLKSCKGTQGNLDALLRGSCEPLSIEDDTLILGFYAKSNFQKGKIEDKKFSSVLSDKLKAIFGKRFNVRCITIGEENRPKAPPEKESPLVKEALKHGARIISKE